MEVTREVKPVPPGRLMKVPIQVGAELECGKTKAGNAYGQQEKQGNGVQVRKMSRLGMCSSRRDGGHQLIGGVPG